MSSNYWSNRHSWAEGEEGDLGFQCEAFVEPGQREIVWERLDQATDTRIQIGSLTADLASKWVSETAPIMVGLLLVVASRFHLQATVDGESKTFGTAREKFGALEAWWWQHNDKRATMAFNHFAYYQIVGMGAPAVPLLLERVASGSNAWFLALRAITGLQLETQSRPEDAAASREMWLQWGEQNGYMEHEAQSDSATLPFSGPGDQHRLG